MDPPSQFTLTRPTMSKAIPIINPNSGERQPIPIMHKHTSTFAASQHPTSKYFTTILTPSTPIHTKTPLRSEFQEDSVSEDNGYAINVYARPFIPETLTIINTMDGQVIDTPATNQIDFSAYIRNYFGLSFLPSMPQPVKLPLNASFSLTNGVIPTRYEQYFLNHLEAEIVSQQEENESYSKYSHDVVMLSDDFNLSETCTFSVPGLRENSPYVEVDDVIQLRQLRYHRAGELPITHQWLSPSRQFGWILPGSPALAERQRDERAPEWTGIIYNTRVLVVQRKKEELTVRVRGLMAENVQFDMQHPLSAKRPLKFNIQFPVPKERYHPMQQALQITQKALRQANGWLESMLFPIEANCAAQILLNTGSFNRRFFDEQINWEQKKAIESICLHNYGTLPYLVSGPPGTGKTKTLVETALQLITNVDKVSHILFCAPSDPAADTLVQRLSTHLKPSELLRLNRPSRTSAEVPPTVLPFCYVSNGSFYLPPLKHLMSFKIVVTTCRDASLLTNSRTTNSDIYAAEYGLLSSIHPYDTQPRQVGLHWTALLIDEAAQAIEPEALIPLSVVAPPLESVELVSTPLFVMAGDEHQLGPRTSLRSSPLKTSLFARLFARPVYANHPLARGKTGKMPPALKKAMLPFSRPAFANLHRNYRSHPAILAVPSALFYADTLETEATDTDRLASWSEWRGRRWPVLFCSNGSEDEREADGGGWYNIRETQIACWYAAHLVQTGQVEQNEVCIMSPFKAQVQRLRKTIRKPQYGSLWDIDIGPMEAFQGLERGVVILCTTRSRQRFVNDDKRLDWGVIGMPNKMNVALTRAKFGLIVIGKREILLRDPDWKVFLEFCERNGLVAGNSDGCRQIYERDCVELTRLEKGLLAKERDLDSLQDSSVLGGTTQDDEMWISGMQAGLNMDKVQ